MLDGGWRNVSERGRLHATGTKLDDKVDCGKIDGSSRAICPDLSWLARRRKHSEGERENPQPRTNPCRLPSGHLSARLPRYGAPIAAFSYDRQRLQGSYAASHSYATWF